MKRAYFTNTVVNLMLEFIDTNLKPFTDEKPNKTIHYYFIDLM